MTIWRIFWASLFACLFAARLKRNNRKHPDRSPLFRGGKAAFDVGTAALIVSIAGFFLEVATVVGMLTTILVTGRLLHLSRQLSSTCTTGDTSARNCSPI